MVQGRPQGRERKAGGAGKKGKIFLEDKAGLLDLISSVTESKNATTQARLAKREERPTGTDEAIERPPTGKVRSTGAVKKAERAKALTAAKTAIAEKARAKKRKRKNEDERTAVEQEKTGQKRVGFA